MTMSDNLSGRTLYGADGEKLGRIDTLYTADDTGEPAFATVHTGLFGTRTSFVPVQQATLSGEDVHVPYSKQQVKDAPSIDADQHLSVAEEEQLYRHYSLTTPAAPAAVGHDTSGPTTDDAMTRSEQHLEVGTQSVEAGRARLRKYVTTETETRTVPVAHEEVRVEREPVTGANLDRALDGPEISEEEHEVVLMEEKPVVSTETVPVERVRLETDTVVEEQTVTGVVAKEQIESEVYPSETTARDSSDALR